MASIPFDPGPFVPHGFEVIHVEGRTGVSWAIVPRRSPWHEDAAVTTIHPLLDQVLFPNVREVLEEFLDVVKHVGVRSVQQCPIGEAYVQFQHVHDRDKLVSDSPHVYGDISITFVKHNDGRNWRRVYFNRLCWILILGVPLDFQTTDDLATTISKWGKLIAWENDPREKGRIIAKVRVTELIDVPRSIRWSEGEEFEEDAWSSVVEIIHQELLGGGPTDEDPIPPPGVDPHPLPVQPFDEQINEEP